MLKPVELVGGGLVMAGLVLNVVGDRAMQRAACLFRG